jgi:hypothetical protein
MLNGNLLKPYGKVTTLRLSSKERSAYVELELHGEKEPVQIQVNEYELIREGERVFVILNRASTSREWLTALLSNFCLNRRFELPAQYAGMIERLL